MKSKNLFKKLRAKNSWLQSVFPLKNSYSFLDKLSPEAEQTQSVNTITFDNGDLVGRNTDIAGFVLQLKLNYNMKGKKALILGAGGWFPQLFSL